MDDHVLGRAQPAPASRNSAASVVRARIGAIAAALCSAAVTLCSRASDITSSPSGIRNDSATMEVTAGATPARERLTAGPRARHGVFGALGSRVRRSNG